MSDNLWGDLSEIEISKTPATILKEQAAYLTDATKGILRGEVNSVDAPHDYITELQGLTSFLDRSAKRNNKLYYELDVVAPALNDYRYTIVRISHGIDLYPVLIERPDTVVVECKSEAKYVDELKGILSSRPIHKIIASLLSQSKS